MKTIPIIFLLVMYVSGAALGATTEGRRNRLAQRRRNTVDNSKVIYYRFHPDFSECKKKLFLKTTKTWEERTCIKFGRNDEDSDALVVAGNLKDDSECAFNPSSQGNDHYVFIGCGYFGGAAHEVGHALGLIYTHTRYDREKYLTVNSTNVAREFRKYYDDLLRGQDENETRIKMHEKIQYGKSGTKSNYYGVPYDYGSIMHYGTADIDPPMVPTDEHHKRTMGSQFISFLDLLEVNKRHDCLGKCNPDDKETVECEHQGYPNPKNCSDCVCPTGYGGRSCGDRPGDCGEDLIAEERVKTKLLDISSPQNSSEYHVCTSWIKSAPDTKILVEIESISDELKTCGCGYAAVEIKTQDDQRLTGYRFCSK
ncbi:hypothetical protein Aduo_000367 [Ancylostoma duodenale]